MKLAPIIQQFANVLPFHTDKFTDTLSVTSLITNGSTATVTTSTNHNLNTGDYVLITGAIDLVPAVTLSAENNIATFVSSIDNGHIENYSFKDQTPGEVFVEISGANEPQFNGSHKLLSVPNRFNLTYEINETGPLTATGSIEIENYAGERLNGGFEITVISPNSFTYQIKSGADITAKGTILVHGNYRMSAALDVTRAIDSYTKQNLNGYWLICTYGSTTASKDRDILNDATTARSSGSEYRIRVIEDFTANVFIPTSGSISGREARDSAEDIKIALFKSILGFKSPSQYAADSGYRFVFLGDRTAEYNTAFLVQSFNFAVIYDITYYDTLILRNAVPFRDINFDKISINSASDVTIDVDLDEKPVL